MIHYNIKIMEKKPTTIEDLFEMYDQVNRQEERGKETIALMDSMILKLKEFKNVLESIPASVSKGKIIRKRKIHTIDFVIRQYKNTKQYGEYNYKLEKPHWQVEAVNHLFQLKSHPEQWSSTPTKDLTTIQKVLEVLLEIHSGIFSIIEEGHKYIEEHMSMIDESVMEAAKQKGLS